MKKWLTGFLAAIFVVMLTFGGLASDGIDAAMPVRDLYNEFKQDQQVTSAHYADAPEIMVAGVVTYTGPDIHGTPSIELSDKAGGKSNVLVVVNTYDQLDTVAVATQ